MIYMMSPFVTSRVIVIVTLFFVVILVIYNGKSDGADKVMNINVTSSVNLFDEANEHKGEICC